MNESPVEIPQGVVEYIREIFSDCNERVSQKLSRMPTTHETSLDLTLVEAVSQFAAPKQITSDFVVRLDTHYLGGGRHFGEWEIADVGFIVLVRRRGSVRLRKVALLQSKRLYPDEQHFEEDTLVDYIIGFGRLMQGDDNELAAMQERLFGFRNESRYRALKIGDHQFSAIEEYETKSAVPVHYLLYNPLTVPWTCSIPVSSNFSDNDLPQCEVGACVSRARDLQNALRGGEPGHTPTFSDLAALQRWRLEEFVADELLGCREGYRAQGPNDQSLARVFNRRSGPIAAAISVTIDEA